MRPALEVADVFRLHGQDYRQAHGDRLGGTERRVMAAIEACRTATLGGHAEQCLDCRFVRYAYHSCLMGKAGNRELATTCPQSSGGYRQLGSPLRGTLQQRD